ncbi:hypothetical protein EYZ11_004806 [Aspergillus tanneri]|nr:hypothetical protein EYZ11_004806 [Aspergillus tanneri]
MTIVAVLTQKADVYCEDTLNPKFAHVWVLAIECVAVTIAMYCLVQFYIQVKEDIGQHQPFLKILSIKLVIFLSFWQSSLISFLYSSGAIKATKKTQASDLKVGLPNLLISIEMAMFAVLHLWAFAWQPYSLKNFQATEVTDFYGNGKATYQGGRFGVRALLDALNPIDLIKAIGRSIRWLFVGRKKRLLDPSYQATNEGIGLSSAHATGTGAGTTMTGSRTGRYGSAPDEEGDVLLSHAQPNPASHSGDLGTAPPPYEYSDHTRFNSHDQLSGVSLLDPATHSPRPYSPYEQSFHNPYTMSPDSATEHYQHTQGLTTPHNPTATNIPPYPSDHLQEQAPIPLPDAYRPPPSHYDADLNPQRYPH